MMTDDEIKAMKAARANTLEYRSNNSGGSWWLDDDDWAGLEHAGWDVDWYRDKEDTLFGDGERFLGALATRASIACVSGDIADTIEQWEAITGQRSQDEGCNCCGEPHDFTFYDEDGEAMYSAVVVTSTERKWTK